MQPDQTHPVEPATLSEEFQSFLATFYLDPPTANDPCRTVRQQYHQIRNAFYAGFISGTANGGRWNSEVEGFIAEVAKWLALAEAQGARS